MADGKITGFFHAGVTVKDMERSLKFYRDLLGLPILNDRVIEDPYLAEVVAVPLQSVRIVFLTVTEDVFVELLEYRGTEQHSASSRPNDYGAGHLCLYVDDLAALHRRLVAAGVPTRSKSPVRVPTGPRKGALVIYAMDPDGYNVELFEKPSGLK